MADRFGWQYLKSFGSDDWLLKANIQVATGIAGVSGASVFATGAQVPPWLTSLTRGSLGQYTLTLKDPWIDFPFIEIAMTPSQSVFPTNLTTLGTVNTLQAQVLGFYPGTTYTGTQFPIQYAGSYADEIVFQVFQPCVDTLGAVVATGADLPNNCNLQLLVIAANKEGANQ